MEQDQLLQRNEPLSARGGVRLLLMAHGERREGAENDAARRLASDLRARDLFAQVEIGFLRGEPTLAQALRRLGGAEVVVYPLFMTDGHVARASREQLRLHAQTGEGAQSLRLMAPLGLDPALADVIAERAAAAAARAGHYPGNVGLTLVAHGSSREGASRAAAQALVERLRMLGLFGHVDAAYLEEPPVLPDVLSNLDRPTILVGLFCGDGLHGGVDIPRAVETLERRDVVFAGNAGTWPEIGDVIAARCAGERD
jgi:sirohydrochlorin ferrochelatase